MPSGWSARDARSIGQTTANPARLRTVTYPLAGVGRTAARLCLVGNDLAGLRINERVGVLVLICLGRPHPPVHVQRVAGAGQRQAEHVSSLRLITADVLEEQLQQRPPVVVVAVSTAARQWACTPVTARLGAAGASRGRATCRTWVRGAGR